MGNVKIELTMETHMVTLEYDVQYLSNYIREILK